MPQAKNIPTKRAIAPAKPTKYPAPKSAKEYPAEKPKAILFQIKAKLLSLAASLKPLLNKLKKQL